MNNAPRSWMELDGSLRVGRSTSGRSYLTVQVAPDTINPFLEALRHRLGSERFDIYLRNKFDRDGVEFHVTVITPDEFGALGKGDISEAVGLSARLELLGLGHAVGDSKDVYFVVVRSLDLAALRQRLGLPEADLHITLGFGEEDVHHVRKNESTLIPIDLSCLDLRLDAQHIRFGRG